VIPQTVVAFVFFLLLVAPGASYELLRERRQPVITETAFREAARVALYSAWFSLLACGVIALLRIKFRTGLFDPGAYNNNHKAYLATYLTATIWTVVLEVLIALGLAFLTDLFFVAKLDSKLRAKLPKSINKAISPYIQKHGIWLHLFKDLEWRSRDEIPQLSIRLSDGTKIVGYLAMFTPYDTFEKAEIAIKRGEGDSGRILLHDRTKPGQEKLLPISDDVVWVRVEDISFIKVKYKEIPLSEP
jgi:uncharacterized protein DUF6338